MLEDVSESIRAWNVEHHMVHFYQEDDVLRYQITRVKYEQSINEREKPP